MNDGRSASGATLVAAYETALAALEAEGPIAAKAAFQGIREVCDALTAAGVQLETAELHRARELQDRCMAMAGQAGDKVTASLLQTASSRRANHVYRSDP